MHPRSYFPVLLLFIVISLSPLVLGTTENRGSALSATDVKEDHLQGDTTSSRQRYSSGWLVRHSRRTSSETCPTNYFQCGNGLPSDFCCPTGDSCNALADNTTVLCCPDGQDCSSIEPITCSLSGLNATAFPATSVHTTNLTGELPTCGERCCPFGYTCNGDSTCDQTKSTTLEIATSTASLPSTITVATATGTATGLVMATETTQATPTSTSSSSSSSNASEEKKRTIEIAAGSAAGGLLCIGGLIAFALLMRRRAARTASTSESTRELGVQSRSTRATVPYQSSRSTGTLPPYYQSRSPGTFPAHNISPPEPSPPPPPLPPKEYYQPPKRKRTSLLSWVPSVINRTPVELPATPISQWGRIQRPEEVYRPYASEQRGNIHELEADARWLPREESQ